MVGNPLASLWIGRATISEYQEVTDPQTFQTKHDLVPIVVDEPCRVSYGRGSTTNVADGIPYVTQTITLFIDPSINIKEGSVIEVIQYGRITKYKRASKPEIHTQHQEVLLEVYEDKA